MQAIVEASKNGAALAEETNGWMVALFDHEEVGSDSAQGARSPVMFEASKRAINPNSNPNPDPNPNATASNVWSFIHPSEPKPKPSPGAGSPVMFEAMKRATAAVAAAAPTAAGEGVMERAIRNSFLVSADMAHCVHPNFPEKHEENHQPKMHDGLVIKHNANQVRYLALFGAPPSTNSHCVHISHARTHILLLTEEGI